MSNVLDTLGDLAHQAYDKVTGALSSSSAPNKPGYSAVDASHHLGVGLADKGAQTVGGRQKQLDDQITAAGG